MVWLLERCVWDPGCGIQGPGKDSDLHFKSASKFYFLKNENKPKEFPGSSVVKRLSAFTAGAWVQSLVRELRPCMLCGMAKNKETNQKKPLQNLP